MTQIFEIKGLLKQLPFQQCHDRRCERGTPPLSFEYLYSKLFKVERAAFDFDEGLRSKKQAVLPEFRIEVSSTGRAFRRGSPPKE